jgi:hypothetical protein
LYKQRALYNNLYSLFKNRQGKRMSNIEFKAPRAIAEIQQDYNNAAAQLGDCCYRILLEEEKKSKLQEHMRKLSQEAGAAQTAEQEAKMMKELEEKKKANAAKESAAPSSEPV